MKSGIAGFARIDREAIASPKWRQDTLKVIQIDKPTRLVVFNSDLISQRRHH
jgi:hypothetical protein